MGCILGVRAACSDSLLDPRPGPCTSGVFGSVDRNIAQAWKLDANFVADWGQRAWLWTKRDPAGMARRGESRCGNAVNLPGTKHQLLQGSP